MTKSIDNKIIHLTKVEIKGLWGKQDIVWNLNSDVNVLAGINGSGKSTILACICGLILTGEIPKYHSEKVKKISIFFNNKEVLVYENREQKLLNNLNSEKKKEKYKDDNGGALAVGFTPLSISFHSVKINSDIISTFDAEVKPQELLQKADNEVNTELDFQLWKLQKEYTKYQVRIYKTNSEVNRATHIRFLAIIDELFLETHKRVNANKEELEFLLGDKEINTYELSSGEKQLLVILLTVLIQDNKLSILFMDEPEISLHIEWQRKLIKYIRELNPNVQLIIATHSPDIIVRGWLDNVFNLQDLIVKDNTRL